MNRKKILVIVAHPDDEVLGCGGSIALFSSNKYNYNIYVVYVADGVSGRDLNDEELQVEIEKKQESAYKAASILRFNILGFWNFSDQRLDSIPLLQLAKRVEKLIYDLKPSIIFTHSPGDLNIDHQIVWKAVMTAARPLPNSPVEKIFFCEILSSTEWGPISNFSPVVFNDISDTIEAKLAAMECYGSELREFPHPRSLRGIEILASYRGMQSGMRFAEAFEVGRIMGKKFF